MRTIKNKSGSKLVNISHNNGTFICMFCQVCDNEEQVLASTSFYRLSSAQKWANKKLDLH